ncbi:CIR protein PIR protein [Plasmodium vinckei vinckei]|uniref:CIR protein PIR protein n=1 Tax=Plasmodium vinckei vinckei TaxID=54757 RepID=A0A081I9P2_PLAVN|nr:CIR protein PIR protein [Plasmodium vinckei vinckei]KEG00400.1 hypothetical protein YYE_04583 [Plasmodium vinckei vinckei]VEV54740.1 CIR protein PIR protein [Plasmodium vinckei vinckei]
MAKEVCKIFHDVDECFMDDKPDFNKINKIGNYMQDCYNNNPSEPHKCKENLQVIIALCSHLFIELQKISNGPQKRENNDNQYVEYVMMWLGYRLFQTETYNSTILRNFYNNHLMKSDIFNKHTDLIKKTEHLKEVNLYYMWRYYELFKEVCYMTLKYSPNKLDMRKIQNDFKVFQKKYKILYNNINECNSYLILLNSIKVAYGQFKKNLIKNAPNHKVKELHSNLKDLSPRIKLDKGATSGFISRGCKNVNSKAVNKPFKPGSKVPKAKPAESSPRPRQSQKPEEPATKSAASGERPPTSSSPSLQKVLPEPPQVPQPQVQVPVPPAKPESTKPKTEGSSPSKSSQPALSSVPSTELKQPKLQPTSPSLETQPSVSDTTTQKGSHDSQGVSNGGADPLPKQENTSKGPDSDQHNSPGQIKEQGGDTTDKPERPQDGQQENSGSKQENSIDVPKNDTEMKTPPLNVPSTSIKSPSQGAPEDPKKTKTGDKDSSILPQIKDQQGKSSPSGLPAMPSKVLQNDNSHQSRQITDSHIPGGVSPPSVSESKDTDNIKEPKENKQGTVGDEQKDLGGGIGNETNLQSNPIIHTPIPGTNQGGGSVGSGSGIKGNGITGIDDGYVLKKYKKIVISIIVILIPITLTILYKYLSFGRRKELKKKTNMKKVINSIGGKKQIQIIIKSSNQKKNTKKSINSVYKEKSPSLNIYKLMQAGPVPFINLFFLLIFFVYKRKDDSLEL